MPGHLWSPGMGLHGFHVNNKPSIGGTKNGPAAAPIKSVHSTELLATVCSVLLPTYTAAEVQHRLCPLVATEVEALLSVRDAGCALRCEAHPPMEGLLLT